MYPFAIKEIHKLKCGKEQFGYILKLNVACLVKYYDMFESDNNLYIVMDYFENGSVNDLIKKHREKKEKIDTWVCFVFVLIYL
jgi:serine/threonine protein kinase